MLSHEEVTQIIEDIVNKNEAMVKERQMGAMGPLMRMSMKELKDKADGSIVNRIVKESIQKCYKRVNNSFTYFYLKFNNTID